MNVPFKDTIGRLLRMLYLYRPAKAFKDRLLTRSLDYTGCRAQMVSFYAQFIREGDLCFDIGANLGNRTDIFLQLGACVVAVEPQNFLVNYLKRYYKRKIEEQRLFLVQAALGSKEGEGELIVSNAHTISSMNHEWIHSVKASGRFHDYKWNKRLWVQVRTLDKLCEYYGRPRFCKIDVEGFEFEVIKGLSHPIPLISFEFTPEFIDPTLKSITRLSAIGKYEFNYVVGESMVWVLANWLGPNEMCRTLLSLTNKSIFGDVYARVSEDSV